MHKALLELLRKTTLEAEKVDLLFTLSLYDFSSLIYKSSRLNDEGNSISEIL